MPTKDELEKENASLERKIGRLEKKVADAAEPAVVEVTGEEESALEPPSPVDRRQLYVESHPILGVTKKATVIEDSIGDGRIGDGATIVREVNG